MKDTASALRQKRGSVEKNKDAANQHSDSKKQLQKPEGQETSQNLSKNLSLQLLAMMKDVTRDEVTPSTVNAACNCATQIHKLLKLNFEMKKEGF